MRTSWAAQAHTHVTVNAEGVLKLSHSIYSTSVYWLLTKQPVLCQTLPTQLWSKQSWPVLMEFMGDCRRHHSGYSPRMWLCCCAKCWDVEIHRLKESMTNQDKRSSQRAQESDTFSPKSTSTDIKGRSNRREAPDLALLRTWTAKKQPRVVAATGSSRLRLGSHQGSNQGVPDWRSLSLCNLVFQQTNLKYEL